MVPRKSMIIAGLFALLVSADLAQAGTVSIKEYDVPTPGSFPHDPAVGADGSLWYTGMASNTLGRLDPSTGVIREYRLRTPGSGPHGLTTDKNGNIWFTANYKAYIGRLDPRTGDVAEYPMPDRAARDPHSLVFDAAGILWFTMQEGNFVGRLDTKTGKITLKPSPRPVPGPTGSPLTPRGSPSIASWGPTRSGGSIRKA